MKKLLIHHNNTSLNRINFFSPTEEFVFDVDSDKDVDVYIDEKLHQEELKNKIVEADVLFIKVALSRNYLEYLGLRLIGHIRLTESLGEKRKIPIVLIGEESYQFLGTSTYEASILFTKGIYLIKDSAIGFDRAMNWYNEGILKSAGNIASQLDKITVMPPANHRSQHSVTNEWCILRWAMALKISKNSQFDSIKQQIESLLYYKYLKQKYPFREITNAAEFQLKENGKVLLIDDEWQKGWGYIFSEFFKNTPAQFETFTDDFKDKPREEIVTACEQKVSAFEPDLVILDLRLANDDFDTPAVQKLTGHLVLTAIKKINPGIQVILLTASNKIWNIANLESTAADGFILKESPELSSDPGYSSHAVENLAVLIDQCLKKKFLKQVFLIDQKIRGLTGGLDHTFQQEFIDRLKNNLDIAFRLLNEITLSAKYFNYAYLQLFQIIEDFVSQSNVFTGQEMCLAYVNGKEIIVKQNIAYHSEYAIKFQHGKYKPQHWRTALNDDRPDVNFKVSAVLIFRYGNTNSSVRSWTNIYTIRNHKAAHFSEMDLITPSDIELILNFILYFIDGANQNETNINAGLTAPKFDDQLEALKKKFNQK